MSRKDTALKIAKEIFESQSQIEALNRRLLELQREFEAIVEGSRSTLGRVYSQTSYLDYSVSSSIAERVRNHFMHSPNEVFTVKDLQTRIPEAQDETIRATLSRLASKEFIHPVDRGKYRLRSTIAAGDFEDL